MIPDSNPLSSSRIRDLKAQAHHLNPVVMVGTAGVTAAVLREIDLALTAHELIKTRLAGDDRAARSAAVTAICEATGCHAVQQIGKLAVLYRQRPEKPAPSGPHEPKQKAAARLARERTATEGVKVPARSAVKRPTTKPATARKGPPPARKPRAKSSRT